MENRKGNGIFLGIVSVATLIVAIIGATFAYFSASTESDPNAVNLSAYEFKLTMSVSPIYPEGASALIPLNPSTKIMTADGTEYDSVNNTNLLYALNEAEKRCIDDHGLQVCALYQVTITNQAVNEVILSGELKTISNNPGTGEGRTPFQHLMYQELAGDHLQNNLSLVDDPVAIKPEVEGVAKIGDIKVSGATTGEGGKLVPGTGTAYVLVYLNDEGDQSSEMGATFTGQLIYSSEDGSGNTLTGTFTVAGTTEQEPEE